MAISTIVSALTPNSILAKINEIINSLNTVLANYTNKSLSDINANGILKIQQTSSIYSMNNAHVNSTTVKLQNGNNCYDFTISGNATITFDRSELSIDNPQLAFMALITINSLGSITFNNVTWADGNAPSITATGAYLFAFVRYAGWENYIGNLQCKVG